VVAHAGDVEVHRVQRLDRRLVVEQAGQERRAADQVTGRHRVGVARLGAQLREFGRQVLRTADRGVVGIEGRPQRGVGTAGRLQVTVEVVERQHLQLDVLRRPRPAWLGLGGAGEADGGDQ
jgi:hypothetical protein